MSASNEYTSLNVALLSPLREVGGRHERDLIVHEHTLRVPGGAHLLIDRERARIVEDFRTARARPLAREIVGKLAQDL